MGASLASVMAYSAPSRAAPWPPPPPDVLARIIADCRTEPRETIPLVRSSAPIPRSPAELRIGWALQLAPPSGAHIGQVIGLTRADSGAIIAATDAGYWIRVPAKKDEARAPPSGPVAVTIRDYPGKPDQMAFAGWTGEPGYTGINVWLTTKGQTLIRSYEIAGCFPGARPSMARTLPAGETVFRLEPAMEVPSVLVRTAEGDVRATEESEEGAKGVLGSQVSGLVRSATVSAKVQLASGCDELTFHRDGSGTAVRTSCTPDYLRSLAKSWASPYKRHRQPLPTRAVRVVGRIEAPVVAISDLRVTIFDPRTPPARRAHGWRTVPFGDRSDPGKPCDFMLAAQERADAAITLYGVSALCAYYPADPAGAPPPPPPPPS